MRIPDKAPESAVIREAKNVPVGDVFEYTLRGIRFVAMRIGSHTERGCIACVVLNECVEVVPIGRDDLVLHWGETALASAT